MQKLLKISFNPFSTSSFRSLCFSPFPSHPPSSSPQNLAPIASQIFQWAKSHQARYYSFLAFPHTGSIAQKHESFLTLSHSLSHSNLIQHLAFSTLKYKDMLKGQADGSSFPNGGLRSTHNARAYFVWDWRSQIFMRRRNGVIYLPALLVGHNGQMLDDKGGYRKAQAMLEKECMELLKRIGIQAKGIFIGLGLQQQFFLIPKFHFNSRLDLSQTSRTLIPTASPHNQQLSTHYYARLEPQIQNLLSECQSQLLQIGIPIKTRHKQVAPNQYQFCSVFQQASRAIDHNMMKMIILGETAERYGYKALWHQKPFLGINGSGKHMNWSLNYFMASTGKLRNLFAPQSYDDQLFLLFALIKLKAILLNQELYLASICTPGNQLRLGGHEAPPRIFSTFLGQTVSSMLDKLPSPELINLKTLISHLATNLSQQDTDRNRTSPYAYTSNRFEFRAVGSGQNCYFPMTVILATVGAQVKSVNKRLAQGATVKQLIQQMTIQTFGIRFQGDGYSEKWIQQAKKRKLYVSQTFTQPISNLQTAGKVLVQTGVYTQNELCSKSTICRDTYIKTVQIQSKTLLTLINKSIIPRLYKILQIVPKNSTSEPILRRSRKIQDILQKLIIETEYLTEINKKNKNQNIGLVGSQKLRERIGKIGELAGEGLSFCEKDEGNLPESWDIFGNH